MTVVLKVTVMAHLRVILITVSRGYLLTEYALQPFHPGTGVLRINLDTKSDGGKAVDITTVIKHCRAVAYTTVNKRSYRQGDILLAMKKTCKNSWVRLYKILLLKLIQGEAEKVWPF